jgi:DNA helicase-2/ATP-dependent DNA helicase PcrA
MPEPLHLQGLNPPQRQAVETLRGPLLILAGAGSGKTRVLTRRIAHMLDQGVYPSQIFAVTFTNKAASEMKERVAELIGEKARRVWVSTFHSSCVRILRTDAVHLGYTGNFVIYDDDDQMRLLKQIGKDLNIDPKRIPPKSIRRMMDDAKNKLQEPDQLEAEGRTEPQKIKVWRLYEQRMKGANAMDFNDLINNVVKVWRAHPQVLEKWQRRLRYLMVDEYQDTNRSQYELIKLLSGGPSGNLAVVGDDDQSIYAFRGADVTNILNFEKDFPGAMVVKLEQNYRSSSRILQAAMTVVKRNSQRKEKTLWTEKGDGSVLRMIVGRDEQSEADRVAQDIQSKLREGRKAEEIAIIYRTNARSRPFEQVFQRLRIPHVLVGARKFYQRREVRDMLGYLKLIANPADEMGLLRVLNIPRRGLGDKAVQTLRAHQKNQEVTLFHAAQEMAGMGGRAGKGFAAFVSLVDRGREYLRDHTAGELVVFIANESGYWDMLEAEDTDEARGRLMNIRALAEDVDQDEQTLPDYDEDGNPVALDESPLARLQRFLDRATLSGQAEELPDDGGQVTLMTCHLSKGLEYPIVYVVGMNEGGFPLLRDDFTEEQVEEERRLVYVAFTRAMDELVISRSLTRIQYGRGIERCSPSRFLGDIPPELLQGGTGRARKRPVGNTADRELAMQAFLSKHGGGAGHTRPPQSPPSKSVHVDELRVTRRVESLEDLQVGTRILHGDYGEGIIRNRTGDTKNPKLTVEFGQHKRKTLFARYARLEIVQ